AMRAAASTGDPRYPDAVLFGVRADLDAADRYFRFRAVSLIEQPQDIDEVLLPERVSIDAIEPIAERAVFVGFLAPRGQVLFGQDIPEIAVTFRHEQTAMTKTVRVNGISGRVDLE
ncbi:MAG: hypothetical protein Q7T01_03890, partial [bacterium]|nr:hypothetical protein [bacterium]